MKTPQFLRALLASPAYMDKNSNEYAIAAKFLNLLYPGSTDTDATGRMMSPAYDMTLQQFYDAQMEFDRRIEEAKQEAAAEYEKAGRQIEVEDYVGLEESIEVRVLMPWGEIEDKKLYVYTLDVPEEADPEQEKSNQNIVWRWHSEEGDNTCEECASRDGVVYESEDDIPEIPLHPNCRCWVEEIEIDEDGNVISRGQFACKQPADTNARSNENNQNTQGVNNMSAEKKNEQIRKESIRKTMAEEGGYIDNPNRIDQPTNSGITQPTLNTYNQRHPEAGFPENVRELTGLQAEQIYTELYYNDRNIGDINNPRIAHAIFDMGVMSNYSNVGTMVQNTINATQGTSVAVDGDIGARTIQALNNIPANHVDRFMEALIENRIKYLQSLASWDRYGRGWEARTNRY